MSHEKSNNLIERQNKLVAELRSDIAATEYSLTDTVNRAVKEIQAETSKTERMRYELNGEIRKTISITVCDMKAEILKSVDSALAETKKELTATAKEIAKQRKQLDIEGGFRKFLNYKKLKEKSYGRDYYLS